MRVFLMDNSISKWERETGVAFLSKIGLRSGQVILDFGARVGRYTIPAATIAGEEGVVFAVDKEQDSLDELKSKADKIGLNNIKTINNSGKLEIDLDDETVDMILLYDVLHYFNVQQRKDVYNEVFRLLKVNGLLSVYPKHVIGDSPADGFKDLHLDDVIEEIERIGFSYQRRYCATISHNDSLNEGCVLNFRKSKSK
jgi:ubiquinone/menaquinone biosynthesis C-methylase UbiE